MYPFGNVLTKSSLNSVAILGEFNDSFICRDMYWMSNTGTIVLSADYNLCETKTGSFHTSDSMQALC